MKIKKEDLDTVTQNATSMATMGIALLLATKCPVHQLYEVAEEHLNKLDEMRVGLGLEPLSDPLLKSGKISKVIKKIAAKLEAKEKMKAKGKIGFQPNTEEQKTEAAPAANDSLIDVDGDFSSVADEAGGLDALSGWRDFVSKKVDKSKLN